MAGLEAAAERGQGEHDGGEGYGGPIIGEKSPSGRCGGEDREIGMDVEQAAIESGAEGCFPSRCDVQRVEIKGEAANREEDAGAGGELFGFGAQHDERAEVVGQEIDADKQAGEEADAEEDKFLEDDSGEEKNFGGD